MESVAPATCEAVGANRSKSKVIPTIFGGAVNRNSIFRKFFLLLFHTHYMFLPLLSIFR
jgi:hypothetical protein